ncbi:MAG TPA: sulfate ABC transporter permease subunit [Candidatus Dormibacteraeota bacterium]|jgi:sulfate transport system permease protein|nr:sulfate ABC transporter permease subunit [Candidatus Dormibacteraeota bacterium]
MRGRWLIRGLGLGYLAVLIALPVGAIFWRALSPGLAAVWAAVSSPDAVHALLLTLGTGVIAVVANTVFGVGAALLLVRHRFPGAGLLEALCDLPLSVSPVVIGLALVLFYGEGGWIGGWLSAHAIQVIFSPPSIVLAVAFVSLPYVVREVMPVLQELGTEQEQMAATLGSSPLRTFLRLTLPAIRWGLAYGITLTCARVLGEFGAVSIVSGSIEGQTQTLTLLVNDRFSNFDQPGAYAVAVLLALISLSVLGLLSLSRSRREAAVR